MTVYERINKLIKDNGLSRNKLEKILGISNGLISKWQKSTPSAENLQKIADYFHVSVNYLLTGAVETKEDEIVLSRDLQEKYKELEALLRSGEYAPLYYNNITPDAETLELLIQQVKTSLAILEREWKRRDNEQKS